MVNGGNKFFKTSLLKVVIANSLYCQWATSEMCQVKAKREAIDMKIILYSHANKTKFHFKGYALESEIFWNSETAYCC